MNSRMRWQSETKSRKVQLAVNLLMLVDAQFLPRALCLATNSDEWTTYAPPKTRTEARTAPQENTLGPQMRVPGIISSTQHGKGPLLRTVHAHATVQQRQQQETRKNKQQWHKSTRKQPRLLLRLLRRVALSEIDSCCISISSRKRNRLAITRTRHHGVITLVRL